MRGDFGGWICSLVHFPGVHKVYGVGVGLSNKEALVWKFITGVDIGLAYLHSLLVNRSDRAPGHHVSMRINIFFSARHSVQASVSSDRMVSELHSISINIGIYSQQSNVQWKSAAILISYKLRTGLLRLEP